MNFLQESFEKLLFENNYDMIESVEDTLIKIKIPHIKIGIEEPVIIFIKGDKLGSGSYGEVFRYSNKKYKLDLVVKLENLTEYYGNKPIEKEIALDLIQSRKSKKTNIINLLPFVTEMVSYNVMNLMDGNLNDLFKCNPYFYENEHWISKKSRKTGDVYYFNIRSQDASWDKPAENNKEIINQKLYIAEYIRIQVLYLYDMNEKYMYSDIKLSNILYKKIGSKFTVHLGDLGGAVTNKRNEYLSTFPPYEYRNDCGFLNITERREKESTLSWCIGILLLLLMVENETSDLLDNLNSRDIVNVEKSQIENTVSIIAEYYGSDKYGKYLSPNYEERPDINTSLI